MSLNIVEGGCDLYASAVIAATPNIRHTVKALKEDGVKGAKSGVIAGASWAVAGATIVAAPVTLPLVVIGGIVGGVIGALPKS